MENVTEEAIWNALCNRHSLNAQKKLKAGCVAIAGLGGLGSNVAISLARIGVGQLHLVDFDKVDITNLNRQQYTISHIGMYKTDALFNVLKEINPYIAITTDCVKVDENNLQVLFATENIICEAFDKPDAKAMLVNGILEHFPNKRLVAASGMAGYGNSNAIATRQISNNFYICGDESSEVSEGYGLMAPRVSLCAAHEANLITELLLEGN